jgi:hypothetical protein
MTDEEETPLSEIHILPDGRVYLFGAGRELLDVVAVINQHDVMLQRRRDACRAADPIVAALQDHPLPSRERAGVRGARDA